MINFSQEARTEWGEIIKDAKAVAARIIQWQQHFDPEAIKKYASSWKENQTRTHRTEHLTGI